MSSIIKRTVASKLKSTIMYFATLALVLGVVSYAAPKFFGQVAHAAGPWSVDASLDTSLLDYDSQCKISTFQCKTIQAAVDLATSGDTINVAAGTYTENVSINSKTNLTITGAGQSTETGTVIEPADAANSIGITVMNSNGLKIQNLRIHTRGAESQGIRVLGFANTHVTGLTLQHLTIDASGAATGIIGDPSTDAAHSGWLIDDNTITAGAGGIGLQDVTASIVSNNNITILDGTNVYWTSEKFDLADLVFSGNTVIGSGGSQVAFMTDWNHTGTMNPVEAGPVLTTITGVTISGNTFSNWGLNGTGRALKIGDASPSNLTGTISSVAITGNTFQMTADRLAEVIGGTSASSATGSGNTFNVSGTAKIQTAVDAAFSGDTIIIAAGTYAENVQIFSKDGLTIQGVGDDTLIAGTGYGFEIDNSDNLTIKDMKIITNGPDLHGIYVDGNWVGGRGISPSNNLRIENTTIIAQGTFDHEATGIYADYVTNGPHTGWTITGNRITADGGGIGLEDVTNSTVSNNTSTITDGTNILWLAVKSDLSTLVVSGNTVNGSGGSQVSFLTDYHDGSASKTITGVTVSGNTFDTWKDGSRALRIGTGVSGVTVNQNKFLKAGEALKNENTSTVNAESNYWGEASPNFATKIVGVGAVHVDYDPWCANINCTAFLPDTTAPVITLNGSSSMLLNNGESYVEPDATINEGTLVRTGSVNTSIAGVYTITYTATDAAGNVSIAYRTVTVKAADKPVVLATTLGSSQVVGDEVAVTDTTKEPETKGEVKGTSDSKKEDAPWYDAAFMGLAWYWWVVLAIAAGGLGWWAFGAIRNRNQN